MTRQDYIYHLDALRKGLLELMAFDAKTKKRLGALSNPELLELDRAKKTDKMFDDLATRLYEDGAVSERIRNEKLQNGEAEQSEMAFTEEPVTDKPNGKKKGGKK